MTRRLWKDVREGERLPALEVAMPFRRVILNTAVTWDYFPGHHDPDYARGQGISSIYANTILLQGLMDRFVTGWSGPDAFIVRRRLTMKRPIVAGDTVTARGTVTGVRRSSDVGLVEIESALGDPDDERCAARHTLWLPDGAERYLDVADRIGALHGT
ncbi:hypothetical protein ACIBP6_33375 [Nonomuraea terrae]|uniref:hypothetical protein n=1 Tax=Nonomuraea terrae TaxID=2530383 RepID=UPI0037949438